MVEVQVGEEGDSDVGWVHSGRGKLLHQPSFHTAGEVPHGVGIAHISAQTGVYQDGLALGTDQIALEMGVEVHAVQEAVRVPFHVGRPVGGGYCGEDVRQGQGQLGVVKGQDLDFANGQTGFRHCSLSPHLR